MPKRKVFQAVVVGIVLSGQVVIAQTRCALDNRADNLATQFVISAGYVKMPIGAFLLIRKNGEIGAIRLTSIDPTGTEWYGKFVYESYFQGDGSDSFLAGNVVRQTEELNLRLERGLGRPFMYQPGPYMARIGKWKFPFGKPSMITMSDIRFWSGIGDHGYEFAPTSACNVSEIDVHDKRLRWFRFDWDAHITLPLADLPK